MGAQPSLLEGADQARHVILLPNLLRQEHCGSSAPPASRAANADIEQLQEAEGELWMCRAVVCDVAAKNEIKRSMLPQCRRRRRSLICGRGKVQLHNRDAQNIAEPGRVERDVPLQQLKLPPAGGKPGQHQPVGEHHAVGSSDAAGQADCTCPSTELQDALPPHPLPDHVFRKDAGRRPHLQASCMKPAACLLVQLQASSSAHGVL
mmetsp:Transcript_20013/g.40658  ORF Transcript_20013/g.40658 Transcript_20013/m.40658 type:complete len:206 (+) Transcript_20013:297-914(+)